MFKYVEFFIFADIITKVLQDTSVTVSVNLFSHKVTLKLL